MRIHSRLLYCKKCRLFIPRSCLTSHSSMTSPYFIMATCESCYEVWFLCALHNRRWTARNQYAAVQHFNDSNISHSENIDEVDTNSIDGNNDNDDHMESISSDNENLNDNLHAPHQSINNQFASMSFNSQQYFSLMAKNTHEIPAQYLVHSAFGESSVPSSQFCNLFETEFHIQATRLCLSMTNLQHVSLVNMFHMLWPCMRTVNDGERFVSTRLPTSLSDVKKFYLTNSTSIRKSLPHPEPVEIENHAVIKIKDILSHMFAYGTKMDGICPYENHEYTGTYVGLDDDTVRTPFVQDVINSILQKFPPSEALKPLLLFGKVWSDGFDANNVVHSAPSLWLRTITISPPKNMSTSTRHTFVLHMSREGICHEKINKIFDAELRALERGQWFYSTLLNKSIFVIFKIHVYTADRPERGKLTHILGHSGHTTKRWMYAAYLPSSQMQSCKTCFQHRVKASKKNPTFCSTPRRRCSRCADWDFNHPQMGVPFPLGYPDTYHDDGPHPHAQRQMERIKNLYPMILSFDNLKANAQFIFFNVYKKTFKFNDARVYGKSVGLSGDCINNLIIAPAKMLRVNSPNHTYDEVIKKFKYPVLWDCPIALNQYIDAPMHLLFQGIIKSLIEMISEWLTALPKTPSYHKEFCQIIHPTMLAISNMNLKWCFMNIFHTAKNYKTTGWIANNYLAFARLMLVFYRYIRHVVPNSLLGLIECEAMIQSGLCVVSYIMSQHNKDPSPILEYTKLFLSCVDKFESKIYVEGSINHIWRSRGNFLSLLNLPLQQEYFGTVRNFWEGEHERYIQHIKPLLKQLRHTTSFLVTKLEKLYQIAALDFVLESIPDSYHSNLSPIKYERNKNFIVHKNIKVVNNMLVNQKPISGIELRDSNQTDVSHYCVVVKTMDKSLDCYRVVFQNRNGITKCAHHYRRLQPFDEDTNIAATYKTTIEVENHTLHYILLIPNLDKVNNYQYTIISNEWTYLHQDMNLQFCHIDTNLFNNL